MHDRGVVGASREPAIWWVIRASSLSIMRSIIYESMNQHKQCVLLCWLSLQYRVKVGEGFIFLPGSRTEPKAIFLQRVLSFEWFWKPSCIFVLGTRSRLRSPSCYMRFFVVHALPARLLAERCTPMTHAEWHNKRCRFLT